MVTRSRRQRRLFVAAAIVAAGCLGASGLAQAGMTGRSAAGPRAQAAPATSAEVFVALASERVLDTRGPANGPIGVPAAGPLSGGQQIDLPLTTPAPNRASAPLPANATAAVINVTIDDDASVKSFLTVWPSGTPRPFTSANNAEPGLVSPNLTIAKLGPTGGVSFYAQQGAINLAVDLVGYTVPLSSVGVGGGAPLLTGHGAPTATTGNDGDVYLDLTTGSFYGPRTAGVWLAAVPTPPPTAVAEGTDDVAIDLSTDVLPTFGGAETVWTVSGLNGATDHLLDAAIVVQPNAALTADAAIQCWWSTRPDRIFTTHVTAPGADDVLLHAETLAVPGSIAGADTADLVCQTASTSAIVDAVAITAVHVNTQHVALTSDT
jgi:hypothetical protein